MKRVTGIGGVFFRAKDPAASQAWYRDRLGLPVGEDGNALFRWRESDEPNRSGTTVWAAFEADTDYFGESGQPWMINYRVDDLDALCEQLRREGVEIVSQSEEHEYGKFAWIVDPDGNRVELWEPPRATEA
jgi:catechol 2,3-dioxygenase-like lactoylglutathione lyase family enzyme